MTSASSWRSCSPARLRIAFITEKPDGTPGDAVDVAKALRDFAATNPALVVKGGVLGTKPLTADEAQALAEVEPRDVLLAKLAGALAAPMVSSSPGCSRRCPATSPTDSRPSSTSRAVSRRKPAAPSRRGAPRRPSRETGARRAEAAAEATRRRRRPQPRRTDAAPRPPQLTPTTPGRPEPAGRSHHGGELSMPTKEDILDSIASMTVLELSELLKEFEEKFGVTAAAPVAVAAAAPAGGGGGAAEAEEEKDEFDVVLTEAGDKKIQVIKEVRALTNLGLKEAKDLVDGAPKPRPGEGVQGGRREGQGSLEEAGGKVELK